jgi:hypothetical protein
MHSPGPTSAERTKPEPAAATTGSAGSGTMSCRSKSQNMTVVLAGPVPLQNSSRCADLRFGSMVGLRKDRGLCPFVSCRTGWASTLRSCGQRLEVIGLNPGDGPEQWIRGNVRGDLVRAGYQSDPAAGSLKSSSRPSWNSSSYRDDSLASGATRSDPEARVEAAQRLQLGHVFGTAIRRQPSTAGHSRTQRKSARPRSCRSDAVLTDLERWAGAGSNRRPSAFQCHGCPFVNDRQVPLLPVNERRGKERTAAYTSE